MGGIAGLDVLNEMVEFLKLKMKNKVTIDVIWNEKSVGLGTNGYNVIYLSLISENINIYSLQYKDANGNPTWDWLHEVHFSFDVRTGKSEEHVLTLVDELVGILKSNVVPVHKSTNRNVQLLPGPATSMNEEYRNIFRYVVDCEALVFNP